MIDPGVIGGSWWPLAVVLGKIVLLAAGPYRGTRRSNGDNYYFSP